MTSFLGTTKVLCPGQSVVVARTSASWLAGTSPKSERMFGTLSPASNHRTEAAWTG